MEEKGQTNKVDEMSLKAVFLSNHKSQYIFKKTKKIANASYLLTDHIKDTEPIKWAIRKNASDILCAEMSFIESTRTKLFPVILNLRSFFETAFVARLVSQSNAQIMMSQLDILLEEINNLGMSESAEQLVTDSFFAVEKLVLPSRENVSESLLRDKVFVPKNEGVSYKGQSNNKGQEVYKRHNVLETEDFDKRQRRENILAIIKQNKEVMIKDISAKIKNCSEKTIQRELNSMLALHLIKKTGERRWSRYSLV